MISLSKDEIMVEKYFFHLFFPDPDIMLTE